MLQWFIFLKGTIQQICTHTRVAMWREGTPVIAFLKKRLPYSVNRLTVVASPLTGCHLALCLPPVYQAGDRKAAPMRGASALLRLLSATTGASVQSTSLTLEWNPCLRQTMDSPGQISVYVCPIWTSPFCVEKFELFLHLAGLPSWVGQLEGQTPPSSLNFHYVPNILHGVHWFGL